MIFDKEQWKVIAEDDKVLYGGFVRNSVVVHTAPAYVVYIRVPTDFFPFIEQYCPEVVSLARKKPLSFYLDNEEGHWVFGYYVPLRWAWVDLWLYRGLPEWANEARASKILT